MYSLCTKAVQKLKTSTIHTFTLYLHVHCTCIVVHSHKYMYWQDIYTNVHTCSWQISQKQSKIDRGKS